MSLGYGPDGKTWRRHKVSGKTRAEVAVKLSQLKAELDSGVQPEHAYTVQRAVDDWLAEGLDGRSARTVTLNRHVLKPVTAVIGGIELRKLTAHDVRRALVQLAKDHSSRTVTIAHNALTRALRHAEANRHVVHNAAALVDTPKGQSGRPSKALTLELHGWAIALGAAGFALLGFTLFLVLQVMRPRTVSYDQVQDAKKGRFGLHSPLYKWQQVVMSQHDLYLPRGVKSLDGLRDAMIIEEVTLMSLARAKGTADNLDTYQILCAAENARVARLVELRGTAAKIVAIGEYYNLHRRSTLATYFGVVCGVTWNNGAGGRFRIAAQLRSITSTA